MVALAHQAEKNLATVIVYGRDASNLLPVLFGAIVGQKLGAADGKGVSGHSTENPRSQVEHGNYPASEQS